MTLTRGSLVHGASCRQLARLRSGIPSKPPSPLHRTRDCPPRGPAVERVPGESWKVPADEVQAFRDDPQCSVVPACMRRVVAVRRKPRIDHLQRRRICDRASNPLDEHRQGVSSECVVRDTQTEEEKLPLLGVIKLLEASRCDERLHPRPERTTP
jgi:hypothetical protein